MATMTKVESEPRSAGYHGDKSSNYQLPNDEIERERLHIQHLASLALLDNKPLHAPVNNPKKIIDIGCGVNADMTLYLASAFPSAKVYALDLSEIKLEKEKIPSNVEFIRGNFHHLIGVDPRMGEGTFDFVFSRYLCAGIEDWSAHVAKVATLLKKGGWLEMHDAYSLCLWQNDKIITDSTQWIQYVSPPKPWPENDPWALQFFLSLLRSNGFEDVDGFGVSAPWERPPLTGEKAKGNAWAEYVSGGRFFDWVEPIFERLFPGEQGRERREMLIKEARGSFEPEVGKEMRSAVFWGRKT